jgi:ABC-type uncharacterized transport system auxiliary subunit
VTTIRSLRSALLALALGWAAAGCLGRRLPPIQYHRIELRDTTALRALPPHPAIAAGRTAVLAYRTPGIYGDRQIHYRLEGGEYGSYASREWALPLGTMLGVLTQDVLRLRPLTTGGTLFDPPSRAEAAYVWRGTVRELDEVVHGRAVHAAVALDLQLARASDDSVVWSGTARRERAVGGGTMEAIVTTLGALAAECVDELAARASRALAASPPR